MVLVKMQAWRRDGIKGSGNADTVRIRTPNNDCFYMDEFFMFSKRNVPHLLGVGAFRFSCFFGK